MSSDRTKAILGALGDKCTCVYVENEKGDPELLMYHCAQCHAVEWIEALEGEAMLLRRSLGQRQEQLETAEARAERLRAELQMVLDEFGYSLPPDTKASITSAIRAAAGGGN
jgi:hypothetical protein